MTTPNIIMTRIDERLIHGQGQLWVKYLGCNTVIVANDEVSTDKMQQTLMKTVVLLSVRCAVTKETLSWSASPFPSRWARKSRCL